MMEWQPIETAPRDGEPILCAREDSVFIVRWWTLDDNGWSVDLEGNDYCRVIADAYAPTHWMPLPAPPEKRP